jgi:GT2 family glycosyltransferase/LmbE family N-acetylglucosaminyl deacetylase
VNLPAPVSHTERLRARHALVIAPHYDDEVLGCGGAIAQLAAAGTHVTVMFLSDSAGAPGDPEGGADYSARRRAESDAACARLGVAQRIDLALPDGALAQAQHLRAAADAIEAYIRAAAAHSAPAPATVATAAISAAPERLLDLLFVPSPSEITLDHQAACAAVHEAIQRLRGADEDAIRRVDVLCYEVNHSSHPDLLVDVSAQVGLIESAMACYASQQARHDYLGAALGHRRFRTLTLTAASGVTHAEAYRRLCGWDFATRSLAQLVAFAVGGGIGTPAAGPSGALPAFAAAAVAASSAAAAAAGAAAGVAAADVNVAGAIAAGASAGVRADESAPLVSVIVRTRDRPALLREALASLAASIYRQVEVVLVNDGGVSPAIEAEAETPFPFPLIRVEHETPKGRAAAAQAGVDAARGEFIAFLDDDDLVAPEHLSTLVSIAQATGARVVYSDAAVAVYEPAIADSANHADSAWTCVQRELPYARDFDADRLLVDNYIPLNTLLIERALFRAAGPFDTTLEIFEDWDMLIRLAALTPFQHIPRVTAEYRHFRGAATGRGHSQALGEDGWRRPDFEDMKARVLAKHAPQLNPRTLARIVIGLRAEADESDQRRRRLARDAEAESANLRETLDRVNTELRRVYDEEARLTAAAADLSARLAAAEAAAAAAEASAAAAMAKAAAVEAASAEAVATAAAEAAAAQADAAAATAVADAAAVSASANLARDAAAAGPHALAAVPLEPVASAPPALAAVPIRKASILLASWNGREHLDTCLDALSRLDAPGLPWDCWVLDNGSRDGTVDWLRTRHPNVRVVASPTNLGFCAAYNRLAAEADGDVLVFLNNDTRPAADWLGHLIDALGMAPPDVAAAAGLITDWDGERLDFGRGVMTFDGHAFQLDTGRALPDVTLPSSGEEQLFGCGANMIIRRDAFLAAGGFDEQFFAYFDDVDLGWRLWSGGARVISAPQAVVRHRSASTSDTLGQYNRGFLFERNAFLTAFKNYDAAMWEKMMPAVLLTFASRLITFLATQNPGGHRLAQDPFAATSAASTSASASVSASSASAARAAAAGSASAMAASAVDGGGISRWFSRTRSRALAQQQTQQQDQIDEHPIVSDPLTVAQARALAWLLRHMDAAAERRHCIQSRRRRPDAEIFAQFPLHIVPTYAGDEALFQSAGFQAWLPEAPRLVFRTLDEIMARR